MFLILDPSANYLPMYHKIYMVILLNSTLGTLAASVSAFITLSERTHTINSGNRTGAPNLKKYTILSGRLLDYCENIGTIV